MEAMMLKSDLWQLLELEAKEESRTVSDMVHEAIEQYLYERRLAKIDHEIMGYEQLHAELCLNHLGQWVAIHQQKLVDVDSDRAKLYQRVRSQYGQIPVLIRQVAEIANEDLWLRNHNEYKLKAVNVN